MAFHLSLTASGLAPHMRLFCRSYSARSAINTISVVGSGLMGSGIAQVAASTGHQVYLYDVDSNALASAKKRIFKSLERVAGKKHSGNEAEAKAMVENTLAKIHFTNSLEEAAKNTQVLMEAIVENIQVKRELFQIVDKIAPESAVFASNTSSLSIEEICNGVRPDRFGGLHFFNPVPMMKLVEVIRIKTTSDSTHNALNSLTTSMGKTAVQCKDTPGFIVNRLLVPYMGEAIRMVERGDATMEDVDTAMKLGAGYPMGPFQLADYVGLDTLKFILAGWHEKYPDEPLFKPSESVNKLVAAGKLGMKSGSGFYTY